MEGAQNIWDILHAAIGMWKMVSVVFVWRQRFGAGFYKLINPIHGTNYGSFPSERVIEEWLWDTNTLGISQVLEACKFDDFIEGLSWWHHDMTMYGRITDRLTIDCTMMTSSNGNLFCVTGHLCSEFTGPRWIPLTKGQWRGALMFSMIYAWINSWVNNRKAGDLRRNHAHYEVSVMTGLDAIENQW